MACVLSSVFFFFLGSREIVDASMCFVNLKQIHRTLAFGLQSFSMVRLLLDEPLQGKN